MQRKAVAREGDVRVLDPTGHDDGVAAAHVLVFVAPVGFVFAALVGLFFYLFEDALRVPGGNQVDGLPPVPSTG